ncbi:helix-turn-helix domain-containing protein [Anaerotignum propionicum]|uniref:helix-turn-helix domain-containing protein n=1 Tax=Anaerotignum propionicum TaxID=28446 RepID=UPI00210F1C8C|nr:helix-turn-helix domain-containing protein [Anaerotignum propionicum]MCQ4936738.1 helix-turn-helix domain-containing protein [Anaerotignum propionicum]
MDTIDRILILMENHQMKQADLARVAGARSSSVSDWFNRKSSSYTKYLDKIAKHFGVTVDYLMTGKTNTDETPYYINDDAREIAEELAQNPNLHILFDTARGVSAEDLQFVIDMVKRLKQDSE